MHFLYMGFSQQANIRCYRFEGVVPRERPSQLTKNIKFLLSADISVMAEHRIRIQDGPVLCLQILSAALEGAADNTTEFTSYAITSKDFSAFASAREATEVAKTAHRRPRPPAKPSPSSQLKWPQFK